MNLLANAEVSFVLLQKKGRTKRQTHIFRRTDIFYDNVENLQPASVIQKPANTVVLVSTGQYKLDRDNQTGQTNEIEDSTDWLLQRVRLPSDGGKTFCKQIRNHEATTCGDGSFKLGKAVGSSFSFEKSTLRTGLKVDNEIPIDPSDASAYAGELGGIGGIVAATNLLCKCFGIIDGTVTHGVDNDAALSNCFGPYEPNTSTPCFHIVKRIRAEIKKSPITWRGKKVKAHQDDVTDEDQLDFWAKANILADKQAKAHLRRVLGRSSISCVQQFQNEGWTVQIGRKRITRHFDKQIIYHCTKDAIKRYWCDRLGIAYELIETIDWKVFVKSTSDMSAARRLFITKHAAGISATGRNMLRRKQHETSQCPRCKADDEHTKHIFTCTGNGTQETFNTGMAELNIWLGQTTSTDIGDAVEKFLQQCRYEGQPRNWNEWQGTEDITAAVMEQEILGEEAFLTGVVSKKWAQAQRRHLDRSGSRKCETKWTATLTMKVIEIVADLWKHRNEALHQRDNVVRQRDHDKLNGTIDECMRTLPRSLRVFTAAEQRFFKRTNITQLKQCKLQRKQQWIDTAQSIITSFRENLHNNPQARVMWRAMNLIQNDHTQQTQLDENDQQNENTDTDYKTDNDEDKTIANAVDITDNDISQDTADTNEETEENTYIDSTQTNELYILQNQEDKDDKNVPNG